ncbi:MAG: DUF3108 domain-containing protein, partial [Pseudomonadota bacterium]
MRNTLSPGVRCAPLVGVVALLATAAAAADLTEFDARFSGRVSVAKVEIDGRLRKEPGTGTYVYVRESEPRGFARMFRREGVRECARFRVSDTGPVPISYEYRDGDDFGGKSSRILFDHDRATAVSEYRGETVEIPIPADVGPVYDRLSEELAVPQELDAAPDAFSLLVIERNALHTVRYRKLGAEELEIGGERHDTVVYERRRGNSSRTSRIWYATALNHRPLRIERFKDGKSQGAATLDE